jgi:fructose-1,6-bisphosphatase I / sedoheptulose-1,7-bisphosphatase
MRMTATHPTANPHATLGLLVTERERREGAGGPGRLLLDLAAGVRAISAVLARAVLAGAAGDASSENAHGEQQKKMDVLANELLVEACVRGGRVAAVASEELATPYVVPRPSSGGAYLVAMDPLDGSSNLDVGATVGTIFSVLRRPEGVPLGPDAFLQPGTRQVCAAYAVYGPCTMLVVALEGEVNGFTLDPATGQFVLTHPRMRIPEETREYGINASNARHWEPPVRRYVDECVAGRAGARGVDFNMRWVGTMVADVHRVLVRGGTFLYPRDARDPSRPGKLRLLYEAAPMALVAEQAGGVASTGRTRLLEVVPRDPHERVAVLLGSRREVERLAAYHAEHDGGLARPDRPYKSPLFGTRSLLREG